MRLALAIALAAGLLTASPALAALVDGTVAAIDRRVIALSLLAAYRAGFTPEAGPRAALDALIDDRLLAAEARRYGRTLDAAARARAARPRPAGLTPAEWEALVADHALARDFIEFRFGDFVPVSRDELQAYYEANRGEFTQPFEAVADRIRARLVPVVRARRIAAYTADLRARADVRVNPELLPAAPLAD